MSLDPVVRVVAVAYTTPNSNAVSRPDLRGQPWLGQLSRLNYVLPPCRCTKTVLLDTVLQNTDSPSDVLQHRKLTSPLLHLHKRPDIPEQYSGVPSHTFSDVIIRATSNC